MSALFLMKSDKKEPFLEMNSQKSFCELHAISTIM